jgi:hypothetical protein
MGIGFGGWFTCKTGFRGDGGKLPSDRVLEAPCELIDQIIDCSPPSPTLRWSRSANEIPPLLYSRIRLLFSLLAQSAIQGQWVRHQNNPLCIHVVTLNQLIGLCNVRDKSKPVVVSYRLLPGITESGKPCWF